MAVPCFVTLYSNCKSKFREVIIDHIFIEGPIILTKAMIVILSQIEKILLSKNDLNDLLTTFDETINNENVINPEVFENELRNFY